MFDSLNGQRIDR